MLKNFITKILANMTKDHNSKLDISNTPYDIMGEQQVKDLANAFYDIMETDPNASELLAIHPQPMDIIREKFYEFLSGWTGGPDLFAKKYGHPMLRARHLPFKVDKLMRDQWMYCMDKALSQTVTDKNVRTHLRQAFARLATHMINS